jgi:hypothetical protein
VTGYDGPDSHSGIITKRHKSGLKQDSGKAPLLGKMPYSLEIEETILYGFNVTVRFESGKAKEHPSYARKGGKISWDGKKR